MMNKSLLSPLSILLFLGVFLTQNATAQTYCASKGTAPWTEWIANVQIGTINNASQKEGYGNFTSQSTNLTKGTSYPLSITKGFSWAADPSLITQEGQAWIDFNKNGAFEDAEIVVSFTRNHTIANVSVLVTANVVVPATASTGTTRMRISLKTSGLPTACETFDRGEVEDYTVNITDGTGGGNQADLTLANLTIPTPSVQQGQILNFRADFKNIGTAPATGSFNVKSYLSRDQVLSPDDYQDGVVPTANYAAGLTVAQVAAAMTVRNTVTAGNYYLILKIDADNSIAESNENNNTIVSVNTVNVTAVGGGTCFNKFQINTIYPTAGQCTDNNLTQSEFGTF